MTDIVRITSATVLALDLLPEVSVSVVVVGGGVATSIVASLQD